MKIVFVESSSRAWGSEQHFVNLAKGCRLAGHTVVAVVRAASDVARLLKDAGIDVRETPFRGGADPRAMRLTYRVLKEIDADWVVTDHQKHYWALYVLARLTGTKLAVFRHLAYIRSWFNRVLFPRLSDRFFVVSDYALQALVDAGAPASRLNKLYNPIDLQRFKPNAAQAACTRAALGLPQDAYLVGFIGRHEQGKGVDVLRQSLSLAMAQEPSLYALWVGTGPYLQHTKAAIAGDVHASRHIFIDWTDRPEDYLVALDTLIAPSKNVETFGRIVAEAQACAVPIIASRVGGMVEAYDPDRSGIAYEGSCPARLAENILSLKQDPQRRAYMARSGRNFVKRFDMPNVVRLFEQALCTPRSTYKTTRVSLAGVKPLRMLPVASLATLAVAILTFESWRPFTPLLSPDNQSIVQDTIPYLTIATQPGPSMVPWHAGDIWRASKFSEAVETLGTEAPFPAVESHPRVLESWVIQREAAPLPFGQKEARLVSATREKQPGYVQLSNFATDTDDIWQTLDSADDG